VLTNSALDADGTINTISLETGELTVVDGDILGKINWSAPLESSGTDAILVSASIWAEADAEFTADNNSTSLVFAASSTETATAIMRMDKTNLYPATDDGLNLGIQSTNEWSNAYWAAGAVFGWDNNNMVLTHSSNTLTVSGGTFATAALTATSLSVGDGNITNVGQIDVDTIVSDGSTVTIGTGSTLVFTDDTTIAMTLGNDAGDDFTVDSTAFVVEGDTGFVGIGAVPTSSALHITHDAQCYLRFTETSDGDVGYVGAANHMITGGTADYLGVRGESGIQFSGGGSAVHATITSSGDTLISNGGGLIIGHTAQISPEGTNSEFQVLGTGAADGSMVIGRYDSGNPPALYFFSSKHADIGGNLPLTSGDVLGQVVFLGDDGTDETSIGASIAAIAAANFANNDSPADLVFRTTVAGSNSATERMRISSDGTTTFHYTAQVKTAGSGLFNLINTSTSTGEDATQRFQCGDSSDFLKAGFGFTRNSSTYGTGYLTWSVDANDDAANVDAAGGSADEVMWLSATQMYIKGDVGINQASPSERLDVVDSTNGRYAVGITQNATGNGGALNINSAGTNHIVGISGTGVQAAGDHCLTVTSTGAQTNAPVVHFNANNSSTSQPALKCSYIGTGSAAHFVKGIEVQQSSATDGLFLPLTLGSISSGNEYSKLGGGTFDTAMANASSKTIFTANAGGLNGALILLTTRENASGDAYTALILVTDDTNEGTPSHTVVSSTNDGGSDPTVSYAWSGSNFQITNNSGTLIQMYSTVLSVHGSN
jgi:hypothetical protein